jgi:hypothetical protein
MLRIIKCPASAILNPPDTGGPAAAEGTLAHKLGERVLRGEEVEYPNDDMRKAVFTYVAYVRAHRSHDELKGAFRGNSQVSIEDRIVSQEIPDHGGTVDTLIISDSHIHVIDFKYGLMPVSPIDNKQLLSYLILADEKYPGRERFFASIVQPRVYGDPQCIEYTRSQLISHSIDVMMASVLKTRAAGDHCRWCPLAQDCATKDAYMDKVARDDFDDGWNADRCIEIINMGGVFKTSVEKAKERLAEILHEEDVEGWKLVRQLGVRCWKDTEILKATVPPEALYEQKIRSPAQLVKFSKAYQGIVNEQATRPEKGIIAAESSSRLPAYDPAAIFTDIS